MYYLVVNPGYNGGVSLWKDGTLLKWRAFHSQENFYPARDAWWEEVKAEYPDVEEDCQVFVIHRKPTKIDSIEVGGVWKQWAWSKGFYFKTIKSTAIARALFEEGEDLVETASRLLNIELENKGDGWACIGGIYVSKNVLEFDNVKVA